jgi:hypothetical protein
MLHKKGKPKALLSFGNSVCLNVRWWAIDMLSIFERGQAAASRSASAALCGEAVSLLVIAIRSSISLNLASTILNSRLVILRRRTSFRVARFSFDAPGNLIERRPVSRLVERSLTHPYCSARRLIVTSLDPCFSAMRASDQLLWMTSCLIAIQSTRSRFVSRASASASPSPRGSCCVMSLPMSEVGAARAPETKTPPQFGSGVEAHGNFHCGGFDRPARNCRVVAEP